MLSFAETATFNQGLEVLEKPPLPSPLPSIHPEKFHPHLTFTMGQVKNFARPHIVSRFEPLSKRVLRVLIKRLAGLRHFSLVDKLLQQSNNALDASYYDITHVSPSPRRGGTLHPHPDEVRVRVMHSGEVQTPLLTLCMLVASL